MRTVETCEEIIEGRSKQQIISDGGKINTIKKKYINSDLVMGMNFKKSQRRASCWTPKRASSPCHPLQNWEMSLGNNCHGDGRVWWSWRRFDGGPSLRCEACRSPASSNQKTALSSEMHCLSSVSFHFFSSRLHLSVYLLVIFPFWWASNCWLCPLKFKCYLKVKVFELFLSLPLLGFVIQSQAERLSHTN